MTCPMCKGYGQYYSSWQRGMWLPCEHDDPPPTTHDGLPILTEHNWTMTTGHGASMNWSAWIDGQEEFGTCFGRTEQEAIEELQRTWEDRDG